MNRFLVTAICHPMCRGYSEMSEVPGWVEAYIGIPFVEFGRDAKGCDCWGLVRLALGEQFGVNNLPMHTQGYRDTGKDRAGCAATCAAEAASWIDVCHGGRPDFGGIGRLERPGDVVMLRMMRFPMHVGLVVARGWMLHVMDGIDSTIERYDGAAWQNRVTAFYRHRDLA